MSDDAGFPAPGQFYDIGSHKMHLLSMGEGSPVVMMDAGSGDSLLTWNSVQAEIAKFTRVVSYDRSGMGWSERGPNAITPETIADELHQLLLAAEITEPLIVVGHSLGGVYMRTFVHRYPEQVAGLVLVDSSHESQAGAFNQAAPEYMETTKQRLAQLKELSQKSHQEILEQFFKLNDSPAGADSEIEAMKRDRMRPGQVAAIAEEIDYAYQSSLNQPKEAIPLLGDLDLVVLTATRIIQDEGMSEAQGEMMSKTFQALQTEISQRSTRGKQIFVADAGHYIHDDQPKVVIDAVRNMIECVRTRN
ncbi:MAG: alpha/beta hydrolase [Chloroflexota bacterium]